MPLFYLNYTLAHEQNNLSSTLSIGLVFLGLCTHPQNTEPGSGYQRLVAFTQKGRPNPHASVSFVLLASGVSE